MREYRVVIAIPTAGRVSIWFASSLAGMIAQAAAGFKSIPDASVSLSVDVMCSSNWVTNREKLIHRAIENNMTHLLFLDDDMAGFHEGVLETLLGRRQDVVCTNYVIKEEPPTKFVAVGLDGQRVATTENSAGIQPIIYSGFGVSLFSVEALKKTTAPRFTLKFNSESHEWSTEDYPFYEQLRAAGYEVWLDHDASKMLLHFGDKAYSWKEVKSG